MDADDLLVALSFVLWEQQLGDRPGTVVAARWAQFVVDLLQVQGVTQ